PEPDARRLPELPDGTIAPSGTLVRWTRCDRLSHSRASTITKKLHRGLGQIFRHFLWGGVRLWINGERVEPLDPLFLKGVNAAKGTSIFGEPITYEVSVNGPGSKTGMVSVTFTELPVRDLHGLSNDAKR